MLRAFKNNLTFFREFRQRFQTTGAIAPSSRFLANSMTRFLRDRGDEAIRVLEIGPGTGPITEKIVPLLRTGDRFDLVELNETFVTVLNERFRNDDAWRGAAPFSDIHQLPLQEYQPEEKYDFVISGLPLNNFPADLVESITASYFQLLKPGGVLSYFEYMYVRPVRKVVSRGDERIRIAKIDDVMQGHCDQHRIRRDSIWFNLPPAWVQHLRLAENAESPSDEESS